MLKYTIRRVLYMFPTLFGVILVTFLLFNVAGGDPALMVAGKNASAERIAEVRHEMGLDKPLYVQFYNYAIDTVTFNFGRSWSSQQKITKMFRDGVGPSLSLAGPAFFLILLISVSISLLLTLIRGSKFDKGVMVVALASMSLSSLVYILALQYFFSYKLSLFPITGWDPGFFARWQYLVLPILIMVAYSVGGEILFFRTVFLDEINQDYIRTAKSKGLSTSTILFKHLLRNAVIPIITKTVLYIPYLMLGSLLLENFFGIPGLGNITIQAINNADRPVIKALVFVMSLLYMCFQVISDLLYATADPRVQLR